MYYSVKVAMKSCQVKSCAILYCGVGGLVIVIGVNPGMPHLLIRKV